MRVDCKPSSNLCDHKAGWRALDIFIMFFSSLFPCQLGGWIVNLLATCVIIRLGEELLIYLLCFFHFCFLFYIY
jgi:hypothetical protein